MKLTNTKKSWGAIAQGLHWLIFILLVGQLAVGLYMEDLEPNDEKWQLYGLHKSFGLVILLFVVSRIVWRLKNMIPNEPNAPKWQLKVAHFVIMGLYFLMLAIPVNGILMSLMGGHPISFFDLFTIPAWEKNEAFAGIMNQGHTILAYILIAAICLHVGAALYHHFVMKDDVLKRMLPGRKD
jgi:cytochrome b561